VGHTVLIRATLVIRQTTWFTLSYLHIARFVAPLTAGTHSVPVITVLIVPTAVLADAISVTQRFFSRTVRILAALWLADEVLVHVLAGQRTVIIGGFGVGAVDDRRPVADRTVGVLDALVKKESSGGTPWVSGIATGGTLKQTDVVVHLTLPEPTAVVFMWQEVGPAVQVNKVLAVFKRRRVVWRHAPGTLTHVVTVGLVVRAVRVLAAVDVLAGDSQEETGED